MQHPLVVKDSDLAALSLLVQSEALAKSPLGPNYHLLCEILEFRGLPVQSQVAECSTCHHPRNVHINDEECIHIECECVRFIP